MAVEAYKYRGNVSFDPEEIVKKSILKDKTFETNVVEIVSENGIKAYLFEDHTIPIISIDFLFKNSGISYDEAGYEGIGNMVSALLTEGAGDLDNDKLKEELELYAIGISFGVDFDDFKGSLLTLSENKEKAYNLLNLALTKPRFDDENAALAKQRMNFALRMQSERPDSVLGLEFAKNIYGRHPYSRNPVGQKQAIAKITRKDMQNYIKENLTTDKLVVGISGDITPDEAGKVLDKIFQGLKKEGLNKEISAADIVFDGRDVEIKRKSAQNIAIFANRALERTDTDFYPLYVVNYIFGEAGLGSRLSLKAREEEGLTYGIYTSIVNRQKSDMLRGRFSATPENYYRVIEIVKNEWKNMGSKGITEAELKSAKDYLIASYNLRFASIDNISSMLTYMQRYNLGIDFLQKRNEYVRNITLEQANGAAEKYFNDDNLIFISIGNFNREISGENDNGK
jgi:zinc protease